MASVEEKKRFKGTRHLLRKTEKLQPKRHLMPVPLGVPGEAFTKEWPSKEGLTKEGTTSEAPEKESTPTERPVIEGAP